LADFCLEVSLRGFKAVAIGGRTECVDIRIRSCAAATTAAGGLLLRWRHSAGRVINAAATGVAAAVATADDKCRKH